MDYQPRQFLSKSGHAILVGRNARENSRLTLRESQDTDIFFHVTDFPGSHVVLTVNLELPLLQEDRLDAAHLARHYSKAKKKKALVDYALIQYVSKPKGKAPAGMVELTKYNTLKIEIDKARLQRLGIA